MPKGIRVLEGKVVECDYTSTNDFERRFRLNVDFHKGGVGAVLTQVFEDGEHPVAYYSKAFTRDEGRWGSNELEMIGVIKALDHFRPFIWGEDFDLLSDNMGVHLGWLRRQDKGKYARWAARLAEFEGYMTILPRKGLKHGNADGLSRKDRTHLELGVSSDDCMGLGVAVKREKSELGVGELGVGALGAEQESTGVGGRMEDVRMDDPEWNGLWALSLTEEQRKPWTPRWMSVTREFGEDNRRRIERSQRKTERVFFLLSRVTNVLRSVGVDSGWLWKGR